MRTVSLFSILILFVLQGCITFFASNHTEINFLSTTDSVSIYNDAVCIGNNCLHYKLMKKDLSKEFVLKKNGYLDKTFTFNIQKRRPLKLSFLVEDRSSIKSRSTKDFIIPSMVKEPLKKEDNQKYIRINNVSFDLKKEDSLFISYKNEKNYLASNISSVENSGDEIKFDAMNYNSSLIHFIKKYNYVDTIESIFPNYNNTSYLEASIEKVTFHSIGSPGKGGEVVYAESKIKWLILDYYSVKLDSITTSTRSDLFKVYNEPVKDSKNYEGDGLIKSLNNVVELSMVQLLADKKFEKLTQKNQANSNFTTLKMNCDSYDSKSLDELMNASVTVKTGKNSHGSGFLISSDGYIVTNYHVIANAVNQVDIILNNGKLYKAKVERAVPEYDLALLKIDEINLPNIQIKKCEARDLKLGSEVITIGTPKTIELAQSISKGIISGTRLPQKESPYIQANISVNPGNSGGPLIDVNGHVIGIISSKLVGVDVEGIAFAIPTKYIFDALRIEY